MSKRGTFSGFRSMSDEEFLAYASGLQIFTTGQIARVCGVAPRTVTVWFDKELLVGYRVPGTRTKTSGDSDRKVERRELADFMVRHGLPIKRLTGGEQTVLYCSPTSPAKYLPGAEGWILIHCLDVISAAVHLAREPTRVFVYDMILGTDYGARLFQVARDSCWAPLIIAAQTEDCAQADVLGADATVNAHGAEFDLAATIDKLLRERQIRANRKGTKGGNNHATV